jgi:hypothetical protein
MPTKLSDKAVEGSTFGIRASFNEIVNGVSSPVVPNSGLKWSLIDKDGNPVNGKTDVSLSPAATVDIILSAGDLAVSGNYPKKLFVTVEGTYNGVAGNNLPIIDEVSFQVYNLKGQP